MRKGARPVLLVAVVVVLAGCSGGAGDGGTRDAAGDAGDAAALDTAPSPDAPAAPDVAPDAAPRPDAAADGGLGADAVTTADTTPDAAPDAAAAPDGGAAPDAGADAAPDAGAGPDAAPPADAGPPPDPCATLPAFATPADLYDMAALRDPATLELEVLDSWTDGFPPVTIHSVRYTSYEVDGCVQRPVRIEAWVALPSSAVGQAHSRAAVVTAHGLGGSAAPDQAADLARALGVVGLAYSGPGQGASEGVGSIADHLFDTRPDPRASWFWGHAVAAMRGLTVLAHWPEVDPARLAMTGYSGGAVATLMVNGLDDRLVAAVPVSGTGHLDRAARATPTPGWEANLLASMTPPRTPDSPEWTEYGRWLDPARYLATAHGAVWLVNGAQDEFFPIDSLAATFADLAPAAGPHRLLAIKDWDHGLLAELNGEAALEATADVQRYWLRHRLDLDATAGPLIPQPQVDALIPWTCVDQDQPPFLWDCAAVQASLNAPAPFPVTAVRLHWSGDGSLTYLSWDLEEDGDVWRAQVGGLDGRLADGLVYWVEFAFRVGLFGPVVRVSSPPHIPAGFVPNILPLPGG